MANFYPPRLNRFVVRSVQAIAPVGARWRYKMALEVSPESLDRLSDLRNDRLLLLPNHPTFNDPIVLFLLSARLGQAFHYLASIEQFSGSLGRFLQAIGGYSICRGVADRASIAQTLELLSQPACRLVIFPEGGCSFQNDTVMPFRVGAVQLAFQAMNRMVKQGQPLPDLYVVPISLKYRYTDDMTAAIDTALNQLEQALQISSSGNRYDRLRTIAAQVLLKIEQEYALPTLEPPVPWNDRIAKLKAIVLEQCEQRLGLTPALHEPMRERVYKVQNAVSARAETAALSEPGWTIATIDTAMLRLLNFDAIYDGYVAENPTPERFLDTLIRLEREVFRIDRPTPKGFRQARVTIGELINLKDFFERFQQHRANTVEQLTQKTQQIVQENLDLLSSL
jgi:hypothetical protein